MHTDQSCPRPIAALGGLTLSKGSTTTRNLVYCPSCVRENQEDIEQTFPYIVTDADAEYNPVTQTYEITQQTSNTYKCNNCGSEEPRGYEYAASNVRAVEHILSELASAAALPERISPGVLPSVTYQCDTCSCPDISWDTYAHTCHITGRLHDPQIFHAYCPNCTDDEADVSEVPCSAHEEIEIDTARRRQARAARQQVKDIFDWIAVAGEDFGIDREDAAGLRAYYDNEIAKLAQTRAQV